MNPVRFNASVICFILLNSCGRAGGDRASMPIPRVFVQADDPALKQADGLLCLGLSPYSGWVYALYGNGDTASLASFCQGRESGVARAWYPNRRLKEQRPYDNGQPAGEHRGWWEDGRLRFIYHFRDGLYEGTVQEWYPSGQPYRHMNYRAGHEDGMQQIWRPDGGLHANYAVVGGRNYGLTGTMHCKNTFGHAE